MNTDIIDEILLKVNNFIFDTRDDFIFHDKTNDTKHGLKTALEAAAASFAEKLQFAAGGDIILSRKSEL